MKRITLLIVLGFYIFTGCNQEFFAFEEERDIFIFFSYNSFSSSLLKSTASEDEKTINEIIVYGVDAEDKVVHVHTFYPINEPIDAVTLSSVSRKVKWLYAIANPSDDIKDAPTPLSVDDLMDLYCIFTSEPQSPFVMSGKGPVSDYTAQIDLVRTVAKIEINAINDLQITKITVDAPEKGYVFKTEEATTERVIFEKNYESLPATTVTIYVAENISSVTPTHFTINGLLEGNDVEYSFEFKRDDEQPIEIERNKHYKVGVTPVTHSTGNFTITIPEWENVISDKQKIPNPYKDGIKILAIGNSYSDDVMLYMYALLKQLGVDKDNYDRIKIVNAYIEGGSLNDHATNVRNNNYSSLQRKIFNTYGASQVSVLGTYTLLEIIQQDEWDVITLQQSSWSSGNVFTYNADLDYLIEYVQTNATNPNFKLGWHMTWAWADGHSGYPDIHNGQLAMYEAICYAVQEKIVTNEAFDLIIPAGTAIQNARSPFHFGDIFHRDEWSHLNNLGSYIGAAMWIKTITGYDIANLQTPYSANIITWGTTPAITTITSDTLDKIVSAVNAASNTPFSVSSF